MNEGHDAFHDTVREAVEQHGAALGSGAPDFGVLMAARQRRTRRLLATATAAVAVCGLGGVVLATNRAEPSPIADSPVTSDDATTGTRSGSSTPVHDDDPVSTDPAGTDPGSSIEAASTVPSATGSTVSIERVVFTCTDPIGEDPIGRQLFGSCEPRPGDLDGDYACSDRLDDDDGFVRFSSCEPVGQLGPLPDTDGDAPFDNPDDLPVRATTYEVQAGDYGLKIAEQFCVSTADLESVNGWADISRDFPPPGVQILIPNALDDSNCDLGSYTVAAGDTSRSQVADMFCVSVQALDTANIGTQGYSGFYPGLVIVVPPSPSTAC